MPRPSTSSPPPCDLRRSVRHLRDDVWSTRGNRDAYTGKARHVLASDVQNVDHVIEVQLMEHAAVPHSANNREATDRLREMVNSSMNLNVTSSRVNQSKRGPFTAALNRLKKRDGTLREICVEQLARAGRAGWLVDNGCWENIRKEVVKSYDHMEKDMEERRLTRAQSKIIDAIREDLHQTLNKIKIF